MFSQIRSRAISDNSVDKDIAGEATDSPGTAVDPFESLRKIKSRGPAPVHLWDPPFCGDMDMVIARDGTWIHEGQPIRRPAMVKLFASVLKLEDDGDYYLVTPVEKVRIQVQDCPFVALEMEVEGEGEGRQQNLTFTTNAGEVVTAGAEHPIRIGVNPETAEPHPVVHVRSGLNALINRAVFYRLVDLMEPRKTQSGQLVTGIYSGGDFFTFDALAD
jgi:hypothetical protein